MPLKLGRYYLRATLIPVCVSVLALVLFLFIDHHWGPGKDYKSEWLTADSVNGIACLLLLANGIVMALLSTTLFMNQRTGISENLLFSFLAWFAAPLIYLLWITLKVVDGDYETTGFVLCGTLPYLVGLLWTFFLFRRHLRVASFANETGPLAD
jgi:hypothetical protein